MAIWKLASFSWTADKPRSNPLQKFLYNDEISLEMELRPSLAVELNVFERLPSEGRVPIAQYAHYSWRFSAKSKRINGGRWHRFVELRSISCFQVTYSLIKFGVFVVLCEDFVSDLCWIADSRKSATRVNLPFSLGFPLTPCANSQSLVHHTGSYARQTC